MKTVEFTATVAQSGEIAVPAEVASQIPAGELLQVVLQWETSGGGNDAWLETGRRTFESAYAPEDAIYEQLADEAPIR